MSCNICLKESVKPRTCSECKFLACKECIANWYKLSHKKSQEEDSNTVAFSCPQCRKVETFGFNIKIKNQQTPPPRNEKWFNDGEVITPGAYINLPENIKTSNNFTPIAMEIDGKTEFLGYIVNIAGS